MSFYCSICDKSFANKSNLNRHNSTKHIEDENEYTDDEMEHDNKDDTYCIICDKSFANRSNLNRHKSVKHSNEDSENSEISDEDTEEIQADDVNEIANLVWSAIIEESKETGKSIIEIYMDKVLFNHFLKKDYTHQKIMETLYRFIKEDGMDAIEALENAVERRKFLIQRQVENVEICNDNSV